MEVSFASSMKQTHCCFQLLNYSYRTDRVGHASYTPKHSTPSYIPESANILWDTDAVKLAGFKGVTIGVCAMNSKSTSQPMQQILTRMAIYDFIRVIVVCDDTILNKPVDRWPLCDAFLAFYSKGFPLEKAIKYVELRKPKLIINDLEMQYKLQDRRQVYKILSENGIDVPSHMIFDRSCVNCRELVETDDSVEVNGVVFHKPFVEKPLSAEDHNIYIYFPSAYGGGSQRLFRKIKDRSSSYSQESEVRKEGSYIYEEFLATDGTDVKVYTVGVDYAHAEARKSPALDGRVERNMQGKEQRYPVILNATEKLIARKVCLAFKQTVCGFDLLRANGKCYVCDVNGFSFVKSSQKYFDDCAQILLQTILEKVEPGYFPLEPPSLEYLAPEAPVPIPNPSKTSLELRCVIGVIRHGDRTPKQKMKMVVKHADFFRLFKELGGYKKGYLKVKKPKELQKILDIARKLLENVEKDEEYEIEEKVNKLQQLKTVLEMYGHFSGINRKVQLKTLHKRMDGTLYAEPALLLILKWGGELTPAGQRQAEDLGHMFRLMYPGGEGEYAMLPGSGFIRLHSTYRHDLKVYASDEGRVQMTAAAFTKGMLDLEGELASILVHLVKRDENATAMLDTSSDSNCALQKVKQRLHFYMQSTNDFSDKSVNELNPTDSSSICTSLRSVRNPHRYCQKVYETIDALLTELEEIHHKHPNVRLYHGETMEMMINRWSKLFKDFKLKNGRFDISKIPDIYDCIKYDLLHNSALHLKNSRPLFVAAMHLADIVIPQEYGITLEEKVDISRRICRSLFRKIRADLRHTLSNEESDVIHRLDASKSQGVVSPNRHVRTRLYFTSESLIHSLFNVLRYGPLKEKSSDAEQFEKVKEQISAFPELNYMAQVVLMVFEDLSQASDSPSRHIVQVHVSPGVKSREQLLNKPLRGDRRDSLPARKGTQLGPVRRINGPVRRFSDHLGSMFRRTAVLTTSSKSTAGYNTCLSAEVTTSSTHYSCSGAQKPSSKTPPTCSDCSASAVSFSGSSSSSKKPCNVCQLRFPDCSDLNSSATAGSSDACGCAHDSQEEEEDLCTFSIDDDSGDHDKHDDNADEWVAEESVEGESKSRDNDERPRSRSALRSSSEGDMSLISEPSNEEKEGLSLSSSSATNFTDNHSLQLRSSSLEALSNESDYNETPTSLKSVINPLISFCTLPLEDVDDFLTEMSQELTPLD